MAEGAPLLREYVGKTCIEGSNPSDSASKDKRPFRGVLIPARAIDSAFDQARGHTPHGLLKLAFGQLFALS